MPYFEANHASNVRPLSARERAWVERLERVLLACPTKRLEAFTSGDAGLKVIDGKVVHDGDLEIHDGKADDNGVVLASVSSRCLIHAVTC